MDAVETVPGITDDSARDRPSPDPPIGTVERVIAPPVAAGALPAQPTSFDARPLRQERTKRLPWMRRRVAVGLLYLVLLGAAFYGGAVYQGNIDQQLHNQYYPPQTSNLGSGGASLTGP